MGKSSRDRRDVYYRFAKEGSFRARSAFKLLQIDEEFDLFSGITNVVDLCAAPGSWSQVVSQRLCSETDEGQKNVKIVAVDLQTMAPLPGVVQIEGDITKKETANAIIQQLEGNFAQLVLCDGSPDITGMPDFDGYMQRQILLAAFGITTHVLSPGGTFLGKIFRGKYLVGLLSFLQNYFKEVVIAKPRTSRNSSIESFVVCKNYSPPENFIHNLDKPVLCDVKVPDLNLQCIPFVSCGEEVSHDSDTIYFLEVEDSKTYEYTDPLQLPIEPPYGHSLSLRQSGKIYDLR